MDIIYTVAISVLSIAVVIVSMRDRHLDRKDRREMETILVKAILANNVNEFVYAEESPGDRLKKDKIELKKLKVENNLAENAATLLTKYDEPTPIS